ncbi:MAG: peptidase M20 [Ponticaulis sp.]|nr:peptidase M20 [Ponticaulis sp.]
MKTLRRDIHAHPELAFEEKRTSDLVARTLEAAGIEVHRGIADTGLVGVLRNGDGPSIGLRADMDALPILEAGGADHKSTHDGVMHACGHDGHTAMLLGAAEALAASRAFKGNVYFIFQPAEENKGGGRVMVEEGLFERFPCDAIFALHNWPGLAAGKIAVQPGPMMASFDTFDIVLKGVGGHAAMPEKARDPLVAASEFVLALQTIVSRKLSAHDPAVLSVTQMKGGETFNVIPGQCEVKGTWRCFDPEVRTFIRDEIDRILASVCAAHQIDYDAEYEFGYPSTINTETEALFAADVAKGVVGEGNVDTSFRPSMASEDFSVMLENVPGAYIWLGAGIEATPLHHPAYDFNDDTLETGRDLLVSLVTRFSETR